MLRSDEKKFLFVHIQKTAGTSLQKHLESQMPDIEEYLGKHAPLSTAEAQYLDYFTASFVRNPYDRLVSWYSMIANGTKHLSAEEKKNIKNVVWRYVVTHATSFSEFIERCEEAEDIIGWKIFKNNQMDYMRDKHGNIQMDFIGRFEALQSSIYELQERLGIKRVAMTTNVNPSKHKYYREYYTEKTRKIIAKRFEKDLDYFGYSF